MPRHPSANLGLNRYEFAAATLKEVGSDRDSKVVFDLGAGDGRMKGLVEAAGFEWVGFDKAPSSSHILPWHLSSPCPWDKRADVILMLDVIEHLFNPGTGLEHAANVIAPSGWLIMTMPNPRWSKSRVHGLLHGEVVNFTESDLDRNGHVFTPWPHVISHMLDEVGFDVVRYVTLDGSAKWPPKSLSPRYLHQLLHSVAYKIIERFDRSAHGLSYALVAQRRHAESRI